MSAEEYQFNLVQDSFINDLASCHIHPRLLESNELTENEGFNKAMSLDQAEEYSTTYTSRNDLITASVAQDKSDGRNLTPPTDLWATVFTGRKKVYFVDLPIIEYADYPPRHVICFSSGKTGHSFCVCKTKSTEFNKKNSERQVNSLTSPRFLTALRTVLKLTALADFLNSESYINFSTSKKLKIISSNYSMQMASPAMKVKSFGFALWR